MQNETQDDDDVGFNDNGDDGDDDDNDDNFDAEIEDDEDNDDNDNDGGDIIYDEGDEVNCVDGVTAFGDVSTILTICMSNGFEKEVKNQIQQIPEDYHAVY